MKNNFLTYFFLFIFSLSLHADNLCTSLDTNLRESVFNLENYLHSNGFTFTKTNQKIFNIYFDTPELLLYNKNEYISYSALEYLSKKKKKKKYKEKIIYKNKKNVLNTFKVKHYASVKSIEGKHPLLHLIKRNVRVEFIEKLKVNEIKYPLRIKTILSVSKIRTEYTVKKDNTVISVIYLDNAKISSLNNVFYKTLFSLDSNSDRAFISKLLSYYNIKNKKIFSNEYYLLFTTLQKNIFLFSSIWKYPYLVVLVYSLGFMLFGLIIIYIFFRRNFYSIK